MSNCSTCTKTIPDTAKGWCPECAEYRVEVAEKMARAIYKSVFNHGNYVLMSGLTNEGYMEMASAALYEIEKHYKLTRGDL